MTCFITRRARATQPLVARGRPPTCLPRTDRTGRAAVAWLAGILLGITPVLGADFDPSRLPPAATSGVDFDRQIRPLLEQRCHECHGPARSKSGFRLDSRTHALAGGDSGKAIVPGDSAQSPLVHYVARLIPDLEMPPKGKGEPLTAEQVGLLRAWIDQGAAWSTNEAATAYSVTDRSLWSLQPLVRPPIPPLAAAPAAVRNPIDAFIQAKLAAHGLEPSPEADRRVLVRRLYFDLTGLPPRPEEIEAFLADATPRAYEALVDRLLDSPAYGERWARHWLDVVHFGETHGYDKDKPRPNAWPYRDYVIRAFNEDKPYARFVQEQVAGDVLFPDTRDGIEALGFIAAGPWDLIGHEEVPETKIDGKIARHLDRDDMVANTVQTFNSLTVQCAQCHNHKFDPISAEDYYSLQAVFAAVDRTNRKYDVDPDVSRRRRTLEGRLATLDIERRKIDQARRDRAGQPLAELEEKLAALEKAAKSGDAFGYHSAITARDHITKWVLVDLGQSAPIARVVLHPCKDDFNNIGEGFGFPVRYRIEASDDAEFRSGVRVIADQTVDDVPNPKIQARSHDATGTAARFVRVTATRLAPRQNDFIFALAELAVLSPQGTNLAWRAAVTADDSIEAPPRWQKANLTDGWYPGAPPVETEELRMARAEQVRLIDAATREEERQRLEHIRREKSQLDGSLAQLPPSSVAYVGAVHTGSGSFRGTGAEGGRPRPVFLVARGNVLKPVREVGPGALSCVQGLPSRFDLPAGHPEGDRRAALARWLTDPANPLTWRSIVNRIWQYHFGRGLVDTPNDFGHMGSPPSHQELLDWLAVEFRDGGQSFKQLHRLIVTSATYRQASVAPERLRTTATAVDADNRLLWRQNRRKLEAEAVRDAVLMLAGKLDRRMGGPGFQDFVIDKPDHSPHYEYHRHDPEDPDSRRRSIYRFIVRSQQQPFMTVLDCADPSMQVSRRNESVSPLQALAMLNNSLILAMSRHFAARLSLSGGTLADQVARGFTEATGHPPSPADLAPLLRHAHEFGLPNLCRVLYNLNEFSFVD